MVFGECREILNMLRRTFRAGSRERDSNDAKLEQHVKRISEDNLSASRRQVKDIGLESCSSCNSFLDISTPLEIQKRTSHETSENKTHDSTPNVGETIEPESDVWLILFEKDRKTTDEIFGNILKYLGSGDIKRARQVCRAWYQAISSSNEFWKHFRILQVKNDSCWSNFITSDLVSHFNGDDFHFVHSDFTRTDAQLFMVMKSKCVKHLTLDHCKLSTTTLQYILTEFRILESLSIGSVGSCIVFCEAIFPLRPPKGHLKFLRTLNLRSNYERTWAKDECHYNVTNTNLHRNFITDLLSVSNNFENLTFSGWGSLTCSHVIQYVLHHGSQFTKLTSLHFQNLPIHYLNFEDFILLGSGYQRQIEFRELSITLISPLPRILAEAHYQLATGVIRNILSKHAQTLEVISLDRCPVGAGVFGTGLPRVHTMSLTATQVENVLFRPLCPKLQIVDHSIFHSKLQISRIRNRIENIRYPEANTSQSCWHHFPPPTAPDHALYCKHDSLTESTNGKSGHEINCGDSELKQKYMRRTRIWKSMMIIALIILWVFYIYIQYRAPDYGQVTLFVALFALFSVITISNEF